MRQYAEYPSRFFICVFALTSTPSLCTAQVDLAALVKKRGVITVMRGDATEVTIAYRFGCCGTAPPLSPPEPTVAEVLEKLRSVKNMQRLNLDRTHMSDEQFLSLKNLEHLRYLNISGTFISVAGLREISKLRHIEEIAIRPSISSADRGPECKTFENADLALIAKLPRLQAITIGGTWALTGECLLQFGDCTTLRVVRLQFGSLDLRHVTRLRQITELDLRDSSLLKGSLVSISELGQLEVLRLSQDVPALEELDAIVKLPHLKVLDMSRVSRLDDKAFEKVSGAANIQSLVIQSGRLADSSFKYLSRLQALKHLELRSISKATAKTAIGRVLTLPNLESLLMSGGGITDELIPEIVKLQSLKILTLQETRIYDDRKLIKETMPTVNVEFR